MSEKCPVEIEETWLGRNMDTLLHAISGGGGRETLQPFSWVCFRLLQRMADVLVGYNLDEFEDIIDPFQPGVDVVATLKNHYRDKFKERKNRERRYWADPELTTLP
jgi:hypothetical protein